MKDIREPLIEKSMRLVACSAISVLILITVFIFKEGVPFILRTAFSNFLAGMEWIPGEGKFGLIPMMLGSLLVTMGALGVGVPLGVSCAIFLTEFSNRTFRTVLKPSIEVLAGIPSVVYGFMGMMILAPLIRDHLGGAGLSILAASLVLGVMILPTVVSISMDALSSLPPSYKEGAIALGATEWQTVRKVLLPGARSGILAGIILGMGRAVGETMAVIMVAGNAVTLPSSPLASVRTLTSNIALEMGYALGDHRAALFGSAVVLFVFILFLNALAIALIKRGS